MTHQIPDIDTIEQRISRVLRVGVWSSFLLAVVGILAWFLQHPGAGSLPGTAMEEAFPGLAWVPGLVRGQGTSLAMLGLWVLVLTPWLRVVSAMVFFWRTRDRVFLGITGLVALLMVLSWVLGHAQG